MTDDKGLFPRPHGQPHWSYDLWEDGISPGSNTPNEAKAQQVFPLALSIWKEECKSECR